ncbi:MAG: TetR family transcriptional regulator [Caulobacteraceae bacterium]|nr:TetR family transcriptional regulator [Caulobacteraceae bacterium]
MNDTLEAAVVALARLAGERPWREIALRDVAGAAGVPLADLFALAPGKDALLARFSGRLDEAALAIDVAALPDAHDRLFEAAMARIEAMEAYREPLLALAGALARNPDAGLAFAGHFPRTARAILEAAGVAATPVRLAATTAVWLRLVQVWRDDAGALNRTMAEADKRLKQLRSRLGRLGAGF